MKLLDKSTAYAKLFDIKENYSVDISKYIKEMAGNETIPYEVVIFINKYYPLPHLETYNRIYEKRSKNPLYKTLVNENSSPEEQSVALSSFLTQIMITGKSLSESDRRQYYNIMSVDLIAEALGSYASGNSEKLTNTFMMVRDMFKNLYRKEGA